MIPKGSFQSYGGRYGLIVGGYVDIDMARCLGLLHTKFLVMALSFTFELSFLKHFVIKTVT